MPWNNLLCIRLFVTQSYKALLRIRNQSHLPQKVGFLSVPSCIVIRPNDGFIILLPQVR
jgi:hypothetical protein